MTIRLKLICHAPTSAMRTSAFPSDEPLDPQGGRRLSALSYRRLRADRYLSRPAVRATETAGALKIEATAESMLRDCDYGRWTGRPLDEVQVQEPQAIAESAVGNTSKNDKATRRKHSK